MPCIKDELEVYIRLFSPDYSVHLNLIKTQTITDNSLYKHLLHLYIDISNKMLGRHTRTTRTTKPTLMTRLKGPNAQHKTYKTEVTRHGHGHGHGHSHNTRSTRAAAPVHHHRRKPSIGDKISGAMMKLKGSLTRRPGEKVRLFSLEV